MMVYIVHIPIQNLCFFSRTSVVVEFDQLYVPELELIFPTSWTVELQTCFLMLCRALMLTRMANHVMFAQPPFSEAMASQNITRYAGSAPKFQPLLSHNLTSLALPWGAKPWYLWEGWNDVSEATQKQANSGKLIMDNICIYIYTQ